MNNRLWLLTSGLALVGISTTVAVLLSRALAQDGTKPQWIKTFAVDKADLVSTGKNKFFSLQPGHKLELHGGDTHLTITALNETQMVDGVETRIIEERETKGGKLVEVSRNFFAIHPKTGDVYYFGEDVDIYKGGEVVSHESAWRSGVDGAKFGLQIPGKPWLNQAYYQEIAPKVAMDRVRVMSTTETLKTPAGTFKNCLKLEETTPLEPGVTDYKVYAPGIGLVQDGDLKLVKKPKAK